MYGSAVTVNLKPFLKFLKLCLVVRFIATHDVSTAVPITCIENKARKKPYRRWPTVI